MLNIGDQILRKAQLVGMLEGICQSIELSDTQYQTAKDRYEAVGKWLSEAEDRMLLDANIYPQGSISIGTTVKPLDQNEYDVDLVCLVPSLTPAVSPAALKKSIGDRLRQNGHYLKILEEKNRCWRLNYANEFHLDITPTIPNPGCPLGSELLPDKRMVSEKLVDWKETNPKGNRKWFEDRAILKPRLRLSEAMYAEKSAQVDSLPEPTRFKGILRRCVQLCKHHRNTWFSSRDKEISPISIIITTLAAKSYEYCVANNIYDSELDLLLAVVRHMPRFVIISVLGNKKMYIVQNGTTNSENFAEKWNVDSRLPDAFLAWQKAAVADFENLPNLSGLDRIGNQLSKSFGETASKKVLDKLSTSITAARSRGNLSVGTGIGLSIGTKGGVPVLKNTFFGK